MKNKNLLGLFIAICFAFTTFAQEDITPSRYDFAKQPVGQYKLDTTYNAANPAANWTPPIEKFKDGYVVLAGAPAHITGLDAPQVVGFQQGLSIVDLGGEIGKVLCLQGKDSKYEFSTYKVGDGYVGAWCNLNFYLDKEKTPTVAEFKKKGLSDEEAAEAAKVRVRMVFSVAENEISITESILSKFYTSNNQNNVSPALATVPSSYPSDFFQVTDEFGDPEPNEDGEAYYDPTKWLIQEMDITVPEVSGHPARLKIELLGGRIHNGTLLIKEIKFTKNPTGDPKTKELVIYKGSGANVPTITSENGIKLSIEGKAVTIYDLKHATTIQVYNTLGQTVKSVNTDSNSFTFNLSQGIYILKVNGKSAKVLIK